MRWIFGPSLSLVCAGACSFTPLLAGGDDVVTPDAAGPDASVDPDAPPAPAARVRRLTVGDDKVTGGPHADFPVLVALTEGWLRTTDEGGDVAREDGADIHFAADPAGATVLAHEIEAYDDEDGVLIAWVKVPSLEAGTSIYLRYGDPAHVPDPAAAAAVWSADYGGVWHLSGGAIVDSAANGQATNGGSNPADGHIGRARSFNGTTHSISVAAAAPMADVFAGGGTAEAWFFATGWGEAQFGRIFDKDAFVLGMGDNTTSGSILFGHRFAGNNGNWNSAQGSVALNAWTHVAVVYDQSSAANTPVIYVNGVARTVTATTTPSGATMSDAAAPLTIGNRAAGDRAFAGRLDELRLSRVARRPGWIATGHENQRAPGTFWIVSEP